MSRKGIKNKIDKGVYKKCCYCNIEFRVNKRREYTAKYCSDICKGKGKKLSDNTKKKLSKIMKEQWNSGNLKRTFSEEHKHNLSNSLKGNKPWNTGLKGFLEGKNHYNWKGGVTPKNRLIRGKGEWKFWRKKVFERDDYTCKNCGARSGKNYDGKIFLEPHHRIPINKLIKNCFEKYIFDVRNGITLCRKCHQLTFKNNRK